MSFRSVGIAALIIAIGACSHTPPKTAAVTQQGAPRHDPGAGIDPEALRRDLFAFADDSFHGRETGTADAQRAAAFLARRVQQLGLEPAGDSLYLQRVPLVREVATRNTQFVVTSPNGQRQSLTVGADLVPVLSLASPPSDSDRTAEGDVLFVGYGPTDEAAAAALLRYEPAGKILVALHGAPAKAKPADRERLTSTAALAARIGYLRALQPAAVIVLLAPDAEDLYGRLMPDLQRHFELDGARAVVRDSTRRIPMILVGLARRGSPLLPTRWPNDTTPQPLGRQFSGQVEVERTPMTGYNVVAVVRGLDHRMNKTYLAYGAHYDHIGILRTATRHRRTAPDTIANGADDDGSGSVALLAVAKQMMTYRPRRSVLFVWHIAEEKGMLGSAYFTNHSTVPIDSIVAQFNADMIGRNADSSLSLVGPRAAPNYLSWRVGMIVDSVNRTFETPFHIDRKLDDPDDPEHIYERSDHYNYALKGIPIIFFTTGMHADYHRVTDEASKIDYVKLARVSRLMFEAGLAVANRSSRPTSEALIQSISNR